MSNKSIIESLLYVKGDKGISINEIKKCIDISAKEIKDFIKEIGLKHENDEDSGLTVKNYGDHYFLLTKKENYDAIQKLNTLKDKNILTPALMQVLAIIAHKYPCSLPDVEKIRCGAASEAAIKKLEDLGLIINIGRATTPGCPFLYEPTNHFLSLMGIKSLKE